MTQHIPDYLSFIVDSIGVLAQVGGAVVGACVVSHSNGYHTIRHAVADFVLSLILGILISGPMSHLLKLWTGLSDSYSIDGISGVIGAVCFLPILTGVKKVNWTSVISHRLKKK